MKRFIAFVLAALLLTFAGCSCNDDVVSPTDVSASDTIEYSYYGGAPGTPLITEDLDVYYEGKILNGDTSAEEIEEMFGLELLSKGENIDGVNYMISPYYECNFQTIYYPSMQSTEISIDYVINEDLDITRIEGVNIFKGSVGRGISIGDSLDKLVEAYGEPIEEGNYRYYSNAENYGCSLWFFIDWNTETIFRVYVQYDISDIIEEWALTPYI